jgi:hypothetical protein
MTRKYLKNNSYNRNEGKNAKTLTQTRDKSLNGFMRSHCQYLFANF